VKEFNLFADMFCMKCKKKMTNTIFIPGAYYCKNKKCSHFGLLAMAGYMEKPKSIK